MILSLSSGLKISIVVVVAGCSSPEPEKVRPMIYEGMPKSELRKVLGEPQKIDSSGSVFDVNRNSKAVLEKWIYESRTVVLLNDTVKSANVEIRLDTNSDVAD
jgi:hypothetical protein